ncbi:M1 family metallopeptidase [Zhouia sp. PK063]|uniref:M1 family metallopeptidase n=1 Tax=Zhouia sp. PK063 TaxID=3373602 RepID=UPI0037A7793B
MKKLLLSIFGLSMVVNAQEFKKPDGCSTYWQQHVDYHMNVDMNVKNYQYTGTQKLVYTNNSPDSLKQVFYHLYFNAFQPGSEMDVRLQNIADPDGRMVNNLGTKENPKYESRIAKLKPDEIGYLHAETLTQDGKPVAFKEIGTVLQVTLNTPIAPGASTTFDMKFKGQLPVQIRRSGRNNKDGVALSMTQWYPKLAEYDYEGWHADPYIAREFYGVWGDFDVKINIDKTYILGGTGVLQNPDEIGYGYENDGDTVKRPKGDRLTWHFKATNVHDFAWAADPDYIHDKLKTDSGVTLHFLFKNDPEVLEAWKKVQSDAVSLLDFYGKNVGPYPWKQYSFIQGGDGGMEYANCTLITGGKSYKGLLGTAAHEFAHSWFQQLFGFDESEHPWMDEGFTTFISSLAEQSLSGKTDENPFGSSYRSYIYLANSGHEQPLTTHGDRYALNVAYSIAAYSKGCLFLSQLGYIIGQDKLMETLHRFYDDFKFKHPSPNDIKRTAEKVSGIQLQWYLTDWTETTNTIDYAIKSVNEDGENTKITLERKGLMPMPVDVLVVYNDGTQETFYAPLRMMYGQKSNPYPNVKRTVLKDWPWAYPTYDFTINKPKNSIKAIVIDPSQLMADVDNSNNVYPEQPAAEDAQEN